MLTGLTKRRLYAAFAIDAISCLLAAFLVVSILYGMSWSDTTAPPLLGNRPEVISRLADGQSDAQPFSFMVVGDTRSSVVFEEFYQAMSSKIAPDFGVIVGDFVTFPAVNRHRFFMGEFAEWGMTFPVFLIAGNHDMATSPKHARNLDRLYDPFYQKDFERLYGPTNFSFIYRGCLFIGLNNVYRIDYLDYLKDTLARRPSNILMTFVFMHIPPSSLSPLVQARDLMGEEDFMRLMDAYRVDYVFTGDFHSYFRADRKHTKYIITGGGGSDLYGGGVRSFHHVLLIMVDPLKDQVNEIIYSMAPVSGLGDDIEIAMICGIYPIFERYALVWVAVFSLVMAVAAGQMVFLLTRIIRERRNPHRPRT